MIRQATNNYARCRSDRLVLFIRPINLVLMNHFDAWSNEGVHDKTRSRVKYTGMIFNYVLDYCLRSLNKAGAF